MEVGRVDTPLSLVTWPAKPRHNPPRVWLLYGNTACREVPQGEGEFRGFYISAAKRLKPRG